MKLSRRNNNFDFLRFLFAVFVVVSHSYPLSGVSGSNEWVFKLTKGQVYLSDLGLNGFFVISGFFIFKSMERSSGFFQFYIKRILRIFPGLLVLLIITLVIVPLVYTRPDSILNNSDYLNYLPNNLSLYGFQGVIKGVFNTNYYKAINGSLWTIRYEFTLYVFISVLFFFKTKQKIIVFLLVSTFLFFSILYLFFIKRFEGSSIWGMQGYHILNLGSFFVIGSLLACLEFEKYISKWLFLVLFLFLMLAFYFSFYNEIKHVVFSMFVLVFGYIPVKGLKDFGKLGDASYGIYIYSFFIQQLLMWFFKLNTIHLAIYSLMLSIVFGYLSWHLIEKKALKYK